LIQGLFFYILIRKQGDRDFFKSKRPRVYDEVATCTPSSSIHRASFIRFSRGFKWLLGAYSPEMKNKFKLTTEIAKDLERLHVEMFDLSYF
jgi:hypothetical protein